MKEKIKTFNFIEATEESTNVLLQELLSLNDDEISECLVEIIDSMNDSILSSDEKMAESYVIIFGNDRIKSIVEKIAEQYDQQISEKIN
jgi:hypothetical protein